MPTPITRHDFPEIRWQGHWIWLPDEPVSPSGFWFAEAASPARESHGLFRKIFRLDGAPDRAPARLTADSRYALFVNGQSVARGPLRSQPRRLYYDMLDLAPFLVAGENVLAIYVKYYGAPMSFWMPATPNNTLGATGVMVFECDLGPAGWLVSDRSWRARKAEAWADTGRDGSGHGAGVPVEVFDARHFPHEWQQLRFDDSAWAPAQAVAAMHVGGFARTQPPTDPYGPLYPRPIAPLSGAHKTPVDIRLETFTRHVGDEVGGPIARVQASIGMPGAVVPAAGLPLTLDITAEGMARICFNMGSIVSGLVELEVDAPAATMLDLSFTEELLTVSLSMDKSRAGMRYIARGHHDRFQAFDSNGFRYAYMLVSGTVGAVTLRHFGVQEELYPWQPGAEFACSDAELNRIFQAGLRTVQLCSHDAFIDCPTREQRSWVGDAVVHQMVHLATNSDWRLAWHYLTLTNSPRSDGILPMAVVGNIEASGMYTIPDWSLHWVHGVYNCYRFGGERELVAALLPTVERILRWYAPYQTSAGVLKDVPEWNLVDWSSVSTEDTSALPTALWARGLREFAEMAGWLEDRGRQRWAESIYERIAAGFEMFWDAERGSYVDHVVDGERRPEMSQLAGALAIVSGLAPEARWRQIVDTITEAERLVVRSWMGNGAGEQSMEKWQQQVREGRYDIDWDAQQQVVLAEPFMSYIVHDAVAAAGLAGHLPGLYRRWSQFLVGGYDTFGECWDFGTRVHGWSSTPTRDMIFYTLGVTPAEPGYAEVRVAPRLGPLAWARGSVPTPHGLVGVEATTSTVTISAPVPIVVEFEGLPPRRLPAGRHVVEARYSNPI
jgi:hypothetical protein